MEVIREYSSYAKTCLIRTNTYYSGLDHFLDLLKEAQKDFPFLKPSDITVKQYGGDRIKRQFGIEFRMGNRLQRLVQRFQKGNVLKNYERIENLPLVL